MNTPITHFKSLSRLIPKPNETKPFGLGRSSADRPLRFLKQRRSLKQNRGAAAVETAVMLPVIVLLVFGSIELSNMVFLKQSLAVASYEAARSISRPGGTQAIAINRAQQVLAGRNVTGGVVTFSPDVNANTPRGTMITVTVRRPGTATGFGPLRLFAGRPVESRTAMVRQ